jgi:hypothetical protein
MIMYAKFRVFTYYIFFVIKYSKIRFIEIFYEVIKHKIEFGQAYCHDLVKRVLNKFILYFYEF